MDIQAAAPVRFQTITAIPGGGRTQQFAVAQDQHLEGTVVSVEGDTVIVSIGTQRVQAQASADLAPGDQLRLLVREAGPDRVVMQIVGRGADATIMRSLTDQDLRGELQSAGVPADRQSLAIARELIAAGQPVTAESVLDVRAGLARAGATGAEALKAAVFLKAQGLPISGESLQVVRQALASGSALGEQVESLRGALASLAARLTSLGAAVSSPATASPAGADPAAAEAAPADDAAPSASPAPAAGADARSIGAAASGDADGGRAAPTPASATPPGQGGALAPAAGVAVRIEGADAGTRSSGDAATAANDAGGPSETGPAPNAGSSASRDPGAATAGRPANLPTAAAAPPQADGFAPAASAATSDGSPPPAAASDEPQPMPAPAGDARPVANAPISASASRMGPPPGIPAATPDAPTAGAAPPTSGQPSLTDGILLPTAAAPPTLGQLLEHVANALSTLPRLDEAAIGRGRAELAEQIKSIVGDQGTPTEAKLARLLDGLSSKADLDHALAADLRSQVAGLLDAARQHDGQPDLPDSARRDLQNVQQQAQALLDRVDLQQMTNAAHAAQPSESFFVFQLPLPGRNGAETAEIRIRQEGANRKIDPKDVHVVFQFQLQGLQTVRVSLRVLDRHLSCQVGSSDPGATELLRQHAPELRDGLSGLGYLVDDVKCARLTPEDLAPPVAAADGPTAAPRRVLRLDARA